ncbi:tyrosine-type recombinase/integrase [Paraburkholderia xenovorans]
MPLNVLAVKSAKPRERAYKLADERGLYLLVSPAGGKLWRFKYRFGGKERLLALGAYPEVSLVEARDAREDARRLLSRSIDPSSAKREARHHAKHIAGDSFEAIAREYLEKRGALWSAKYTASVLLRLESDVFPTLGARPISEVTAPDVLEVLRKIESRGAAEQARRAHQHIGKVMRYAVVTSRATRDVAADVKGALHPAAVRHYPALTDPEAIGGLLRTIGAYEGKSIYVRNALLLLAHTFVRPSELRQATWEEIDLEERLWVIPADRMKLRRPHLVPLTDRSAQIFTELKAIRGKSELVFPGYRSRDVPMDGASLRIALSGMGYGGIHVPHGFRAMASTRLHEQGFAIDVIEAQLAHALPGVRGIYNRAVHLKERTEMLKWWSGYLDDLTTSQPD